MHNVAARVRTREQVDERGAASREQEARARFRESLSLLSRSAAMLAAAVESRSLKHMHSVTAYLPRPLPLLELLDPAQNSKSSRSFFPPAAAPPPFVWTTGTAGASGAVGAGAEAGAGESKEKWAAPGEGPADAPAGGAPKRPRRSVRMFMMRSQYAVQVLEGMGRKREKGAHRRAGSSLRWTRTAARRGRPTRRRRARRPRLRARHRQSRGAASRAATSQRGGSAAGEEVRAGETRTHVLGLLALLHRLDRRVPPLCVALLPARVDLVGAELAAGDERLHGLVVDGAQGAELADELLEKRGRDRGGRERDRRARREDDRLRARERVSCAQEERGRQERGRTFATSTSLERRRHWM